MSEIELELEPGVVTIEHPPQGGEKHSTDEEEEEEKDHIIPRETLMALSIAYLSVFIDILGVSIILPIIPFLAIEFDASAQQIGFIYAGYAGAQMISVPISGILSDRFGRRPLMMLSLFGSFIGFLFQGLDGIFCPSFLPVCWLACSEAPSPSVNRILQMSFL
jgi:MFS family permease